jgi:hypothetical protein
METDKVIVRLKSINKEEGFLIDEEFVKKVHKKLNDLKPRCYFQDTLDQVDQLLCSNIISAFLERYEDKSKKQ